MHRADKKLHQKENPQLTANIFSRITYWWLKDIFKFGINGPISLEEVYKTKSSLESQPITERFVELWEKELTKKRPSVLTVIFKSNGFLLILWGFAFSFLEIGVRITQTLCLGGLVSYFAPGQTHITKSDAYLYAGGISAATAVMILNFHPFMLFLFEKSAIIRLGCSGLVYRKTMNLSKSTVYDGLNGKLITLIANDMEKIDAAVPFMHELWKGPLDVIVFGYFIYQTIGVAGIYGLAFLICFIPLQVYIGKKSAQFRLKTAKRTDFRVKIMNEIILGIQVIKVYAWDQSFAGMVDKIRKSEVSALRGTGYLRSILSSFGMVAQLSIFISLLTYIYLGNVITAQKVFVVFSFFSILHTSMVFFWPTALANMAEAYISVKRIQEFLLASELKPEERKNNGTNGIEVGKNGYINSAMINSEDHHPNNGIVLLKLKVMDNDKEHTNSKRIINLNAKVKQIVMTNVTATWEKGDKADAGIYGLNLVVEEHELCCIVGPIGAGKSTLLNVIIGELDLDVGNCIVNGSVSYASQESWLFEGTIRSNIIFVETFDQQRYEQVVHVCGLERDFQLFPNGDMTVIGERGISLSGGQKARINLARAVYKKADFYLLDDPLSAVDVHVGRHIFQECVQKFLKNKGCILVTHQLQYLKDVEHVVLMYHGRVESQGTHADVCETSKGSFLTIQSLVDNEDVKVKRQRLSTSQIGDDEIVEEKDAREETQAVGEVKMSVYKSYFAAVNSFIYVGFVVIMFICSQGLVTGVELYISQWSNWEERVASAKMNLTEKFEYSPESDTSNKLFLNWNGSTMTSSFLEHEDEERKHCIITYSILMVFATYAYVHRTFAFILMCLRASIKLHDQLFRGVTRASMYFYNNNPSGRILNRFSKDINNIDILLPQTMLASITFFLELFAIMTIVAITNFWLLIPSVVLMILFFILRYIYINTARSIKRTESLTLSPIYSHINATLQGLPTVRAFNAQEILMSEFYSRQDYNSGAYYLRITTSRAFGFWLDTVCLLFITVVTFSFVIFDNGKGQSANIGLAIVHCISLIKKCQWGMRQTAEMEAQMTSVERVLEYAELPSEPQLESEPKYRPPHDWPSNGEIVVKELNFKYSENGNYVLKNLNFKIEAKEKIGIVGRTGSGKSTLMQAIFRLAELNGEIIIDGIVINTLGLHDLRKKISIIPQDPVLFSGTLRFNLDPFNEHIDANMWDALEQVELKKFVSALVDGLDCKIMDGGSNFSMGQRQLVCLARAILRNNKILICDEATANVDPDTDKLIQRTIRKNFSECTVLTVAHRLHTVMDNDRIMVIDAGNIVEFGHPYELLQRSGGYFRQLVDQTGTSTATTLMLIAAESFGKKSVTQ